MATSQPKDACDLLDDDHKAVKKLFKAYAALVELPGSKKKPTHDKKRELASKICFELTVHAQLEEEIFYPPVRKAIKDDSLMNEAEVEHEGAKILIAQIQSMNPADAMFDAKVTVLGEYVDHHVKEERTEMFPKARASKVDLVKMRDALQARRVELTADSGVPA
ncbi:MAG: hemerythrin domain-containing protein [Sulfuriferula multivorans]|uniref:Hemerythrin domain-containing protein n=1 Tax=Sulfuriferula multivorans TaxID=1559896 RepID=A0A7C9P4B5_9PROT|nr:hemerythrin domain-containing protein [Sulfuriferula multivorans]